MTGPSPPDPEDFPHMTKQRLLALVALPLVAVLLSGCLAADRARSIELVNAERQSRGIRAVVDHPTLTDKAQGWAEYLASRRTLVHSNLAQGAGSGWRALGENLAMAGSVDEAHRLLMQSASHRATLLDGRYSHIGVGVATNGNRVFVVQVFGG